LLADFVVLVGLTKVVGQDFEKTIETEVVRSKTDSAVGESVTEPDVVPTFGASIDLSEIGAAVGTKIVGSKFAATFGVELLAWVLDKELQ
jgi:hypothetical protein